jgi:DNA ligase (NAD+)
MAAPKDIQARYTKLLGEIQKHRHLYYVEDAPTIADTAYDELEKELFAIEAAHPEIVAPDSPSQRVGGEILSGFQKVKHKIAQWSFNDAFSGDDIREFDARVKRMLREQFPDVDNELTYDCELKIDGLKVVLTYEKGILKVAATRGNGSVGEDVTHNVRTIESVPLSLARPIDIIVEGEIWMSEKALEQINEERKKNDEPLFANPRNAAAGSIRSSTLRWQAHASSTLLYTM